MAARIKRQTREKNQELQRVKKMLDRRYDEIKSGKVNAIDGEEVFAQLRQKSESRRSQGQAKIP